jgi:DNA-binding GntR family transcriptional regulator
MDFKASHNLDEQIAEHVGAQIISGERAPGERILEARLARELGVSRGPVREALRLLESRGLVTLAPRRGARITPLSSSYVEWLYDILIELHSLTARLAAEKRTKKDVEQIRRRLKSIRSCAEGGDTTGYYDAIFEFAREGQRVARNPVLRDLIRHLEPSARRMQYILLTRRGGDLTRNIVFFEDTVRYVGEGNGEMASKTIRTYVENEKRFVLASLNDSTTGSSDPSRSSAKE